MDEYSFTDDEDETPALPATPPSLRSSEELPAVGRQPTLASSHTNIQESQNEISGKKRGLAKAGPEKQSEPSVSRQSSSKTSKQGNITAGATSSSYVQVFSGNSKDR